jgi:hypothetical protein
VAFGFCDLTLLHPAFTYGPFLDWNRLWPPNPNLALNKDENPKNQNDNKGEAKDDIHSLVNSPDYSWYSQIVNRMEG